MSWHGVRHIPSGVPLFPGRVRLIPAQGKEEVSEKESSCWGTRLLEEANFIFSPRGFIDFFLRAHRFLLPAQRSPVEGLSSCARSSSLSRHGFIKFRARFAMFPRPVHAIPALAPPSPAVFHHEPTEFHFIPDTGSHVPVFTDQGVMDTVQQTPRRALNRSFANNYCNVYSSMAVFI